MSSRSRTTGPAPCAASCRRAPAHSRSYFRGAFSEATQIDAEKFCAQFLPEAVPVDFAALEIPLTVMATDLHRRQEAPLSSGALRPALAASIAIPGLFRPVTIDGRILIDGGATNPLPFDQLSGLADIIVAVDVFGLPSDRTDMPGAWECRLHHYPRHGRRDRCREAQVTPRPIL